MRQKKDSVNFSCKLDKNIAEKVDIMVERTGLTKTSVIEQAVKAYYKEFEKSKRPDY